MLLIYHNSTPADFWIIVQTQVCAKIPKHSPEHTFKTFAIAYEVERCGHKKLQKEVCLFPYFPYSQWRIILFLSIEQRLSTTYSFQEELEDPIGKIGKKHEGEAGEKT